MAAAGLGGDPLNLSHEGCQDRHTSPPHTHTCSTTPPASLTMISAAAVSHSQHGTILGYMCAAPSATISSFSDDPT